MQYRMMLVWYRCKSDMKYVVMITLRKTIVYHGLRLFPLQLIDLYVKIPAGDRLMDLSFYYARICQEPILTKELEEQLVAQYKNPEGSAESKAQAREKLINANLRFVFKQAKKFSRNDPSIFGSLISAGNEGLLTGLEKFDPEKGVRFLSYAGWWVVQAILKEMSQMRIVSLPIWKQQLASRIAKITDTVPNVTFEILKKHFPDVPDKYLRELFDTNYLTYYIDDLDESNFEIDPIGTQVETRLENEQINKTVRSLPEPHRDIIIMLYGLDDGEEKKVHQIRRRLLLTKEEFKVLKKEALDMLKEKLSESRAS